MSNNSQEIKLLDTPSYSYWSALYYSFYLRPLFVDVGKRWQGLGLKYLLLLVALLSIPFSIKVCIDYDRFFNLQLTEPLSELPTIYVQNGKASINKPVPYIIKNSLGQIVLIVDTSNSITGFSGAYPNLNILINEDKMTYRIPTPELFPGSQPVKQAGVPITQPFGKEVNSVFDGKKLVADGALNSLKYMSELMIYPIVIAALMAFFLILYPTLALLGQIFARVFFGFQLTYGQATRLLIVSSTPTMLLLFIFLTTNTFFAGMGIILSVFLFGYFSYAVSALKSASLKMAKL